MRKLSLIVFACITLLVSCDKSDKQPDLSSSILGTWEFVSLYDVLTKKSDGTIVRESKIDKSHLIWKMNFMANGEGLGYEHRLSTGTGNDGYSYDYQWVISKNKLTFIVGDEHAQINWAHLLTYPIPYKMTFVVEKLTEDELVLTFKDSTSINVGSGLEPPLVDCVSFIRYNLRKVN